VRSTFREDAISAITSSYGYAVSLDENEPVSADFAEFPADLVIRPKPAAGEGAKAGAVYFVNTNDKLNEALLLQMEAASMKRDDFQVIALIEEPEMRQIGRRKFQRAQNRNLAMPIFRGDEDAALSFIGRHLGLSREAA
jgi:hypothetical protein